MGEDVSDMATTTSQLQAKLLALTGGQVNIMLDENTFKSSTQILREMAEAWEDMNDISRASALELMGGKRQANVLSALIQNFDTAEKAIEASANSAGSALRENEVYLDSIQGRIDILTNATQTMWSNFLDSDVIKFFVDLLTQVVKFIDKVGVLGTSLGGILIYLTAFKKQNPLSWIKDFTQYLSAFKGWDGFKQLVGQLLGVAPAMKVVTAETIANTLATQTNDAAKTKAIMSEMGLASATGTLRMAQKQQAADAILNAMSTNDLTFAQGNAMLAMLGYAGATVAADGSLKALDATTKSFMASNPVGWILAIVSALMTVIMVVKQILSTTKNLTDKLSDLKSDLRGIQTELDSVNSELETTQARMAELLALDSLSFVEKEELQNLKATNDELQRRLDLLNLDKKENQQAASEDFSKIMEKSINKDTYDYFGKRNFWDKLFGALDDNKTILSTEEYLDYLQEEYEYALKAERGDAERKIGQQSSSYYSEKIRGLIGEWTKQADGLEYYTGDDLTEEQKQFNEWLDYVYNAEDKWAIMASGNNAKTNAIKRIFNKEEFAEASDEIDKLVAQLEKDPTNQTIIAQISAQCKIADEDLKAVGLSAKEAAEYFTSFASDANFNTLDGKIEELGQASKTFSDLLNGNTFKVDGVDTGLAGLFNEEGKVIQTKLSQIFNNTSEQTRKDITSILEDSYDQIKDGTVDVEKLLEGFGLAATQQVLQIQNKLLAEQNLELFPNLKDEIDGIIDKFDELSKAIGSVEDAMDALKQARAEEAHSGSISIETLENLMQYTDDYAQLVEVDETGAIKLVTNAEEILTKQRIEKIKTDAAAAVQTAQNQLAQAKYNQQAVNETGPVQEALTTATDLLSGSFAYLGSIIGDIGAGNFNGMFDRATAAYNARRNQREENRAQVTISVEDAQKDLNNALLQQQVVNAWANGTMEHSSEDASGGNKTVEDVENDRFQKEMEYWENRISANQAKYDQIQNEIDLLEAKGMRAGEEYYREQIEFENQRKSLLEQQRDQALAYLSTLDEGSDEWWEVANTINDIEGELDDVIASVQDLNDAVAQIHWDTFEEVHDRFSNLKSDLENVRDVLSNEDMFDDEGNFTKEGVTTLAAYISDIQLDKNALADVQAELEDFQKGYAGNEDYFATIGIDSEQEYYDKLVELTDLQDDYIKQIKDSEQSVVEMYESQIDAVEEYIGELIDGYNDYIDAVKDALDAERGLYDFKKNIQKQTKDIASLERRIAALSGSSNAADIAERRKLEAELYEAKEGLNDTYYDHAKDTQSNALDEEAKAYEDSMNRYVDGLRDMLEKAKKDDESFFAYVTNVVLQNAGIIVDTLSDTGLALDAAIVDPFTKAAEAMEGYEDGALARMNDWTKAGESGYFYNFDITATDQLESPWKAGTAAANTFATNVKTAMGEVYNSVESNVDSSLAKLNALANGIQDSNVRVENKSTTEETKKQETPKVDDPAADKGDQYVSSGKYVSSELSLPPGSLDNKTIYKDENSKKKYYKITKGAYQGNYVSVGSTYTTSKGQVVIPDGAYLYVKKYAKGTTGTSRDQWALTDELGDELVLVPGSNGNLSFMRKGTSVVPASLTKELMELGQIGVDGLMNANQFSANINIINNAVNKPEIKLDIENFLRCDNVSQDSMPELKKFVNEQMNNLVKQLNYSLKKSGAR